MQWPQTFQWIFSLKVPSRGPRNVPMKPVRGPSAVAPKFSNDILGSRSQDQRQRMFPSEVLRLPTAVGQKFPNGIYGSGPEDHRQHLFVSETLLLRTAVARKLLNGIFCQIARSRALLIPTRSMMVPPAKALNFAMEFVIQGPKINDKSCSSPRLSEFPSEALQVATAVAEQNS